MVDQATALNEYLPLKQFSPSGELGVTLEKIPKFYLFQLAGWPDTMVQTADAVIQAAGASNAPKIGQSTVGDKASILRVEPLKYWLISHQPTTELPILDSEVGCSLDLSHSRSWIKVSGTEAHTLLNHFLPIDLRHDQFIEGHVVTTAFHHVGITLWRTKEHYNLLLPRSFAASLWEHLTQSSVQYGVEIK
jgi:heterotetrameric sarcosine oxidase gamma subunit